MGFLASSKESKENNKKDAQASVGWSEPELAVLMTSLKKAAGESGSGLDWHALRALLSETVHLPPKVWPVTEKSAVALAKLVGGPGDEAFRSLFHRVLEDGNWGPAQKMAADRPAGEKPWVVLVTGVNGIRKTTSVYQPWFKSALAHTLGGSFGGDEGQLPDGNNSFFRQLDYMIATVANEDFRKLYRLSDVTEYSREKAGIFKRYRTLAEMVGILLCKEAQERGMNVMVETSGRDIASFHYVDHLFDDKSYNKLVIHFTINDIAFAEKSVDTRMAREMKDGQGVVSRGANPREIIGVNAGGPYGSEVLKGVQSDSDKTWESVLKGAAGKSWYKASIHITAHATEGWSVQAIDRATGAAGVAHSFEVRR